MTQITVEITVNKGVEKVWKTWIDPDSIVRWNHADNSWYCPKASNDFRVGGTFSYIMAAKDNSTSFDFNGIYTSIVKEKDIEYTIQGERKVKVHFEAVDEHTAKVIETFEIETVNTIEKQKEGWSAILVNFKNVCEG
jgi:uncharacterized protein YndB with AHSA1/START domain